VICFGDQLDASMSNGAVSSLRSHELESIDEWSARPGIISLRLSLMITVKDQVHNGKHPVLSDRAIRVAEALAESRAGLTRAELIQAAAVSSPTLTRALADLRSAAWLETEDEEGRGGSGSGGVVRLGRNAGLVLGVDIGRAHRRASLADVHGRLVGKLKDEDTSAEPDRSEHFGAGLLSTIAELVFQTVAESDAADSGGDARGESRAIGVGIPFPVGPGGMTVGMFAPELSGLDLAGILLELLRQKAREHGTDLHPQLKIRFAKDGDLGAHALWRDHLQRHRRTANGGSHERDRYSLLYLKASYGIDAGIICHGQLVTGERGLAGQIGHMRVPGPEQRFREPVADDAAPEPPEASIEPCPRCKRPLCLENTASGRAILRQLAVAGDEGPRPRNVEQLVEYVNTQQTARRATRKAVIRAGTDVGLVLADAARLADPAKIVIGGLLAGAGDTFMTPLRIAFAEAGLAGLDPAIESVEPTRIKRIELEGAVALALRHAQFEWH
jgi:predicted NBD/HSP70 family sugar kinase